MNRNKDMPEDLIAINSKLSPKFPNVINEESKTANGKANGTNAALWYQINSRITPAPSPFPTKSSMYNQKNCITSTNKVIKKVATNGPIKDLMMSLSNFLNTYL